MVDKPKPDSQNRQTIELDLASGVSSCRYANECARELAGKLDNTDVSRISTSASGKIRVYPNEDTVSDTVWQVAHTGIDVLYDWGYTRDRNPAYDYSRETEKNAIVFRRKR